LATVRKIITAVLLAIVLASVGLLVAREIGRSRAGGEAVWPPGEVAAPPVNGVVVFYFHRNFCCDSCEKLERYSREAVAGGFAPELQSGRLRFVAVNMEDRKSVV
jgi:hypothetical protein